MRKVISTILFAVAVLSFLTLVQSLRAPLIELVSVLGHIIVLVVLLTAAFHYWQPKRN